MASIQNVGQRTTLIVGVVDTNGNPLPGVAPDAPPTWAQNNPATETLTVAPDGMSAVALGIAAGADTVQVQATIGGKAFAATIDMTTLAVAPQIGGIVITAETPQ